MTYSINVPVCGKQPQRHVNDRKSEERKNKELFKEKFNDGVGTTKHRLTNKEPVTYNDYEVSLVLVTLKIKIWRPWKKKSLTGSLPM